MYTDLWASTAPAYGLNNSWSCSDRSQAEGCVYEEDLLLNFTLTTIAAHNPSTPLFLYFAPHSVHMPLEVPAAQLAKFSNVSLDSAPRQRYAAMTNLVDAHIGAVVGALKEKGMWDNTLMLVAADNGGAFHLRGNESCSRWRPLPTTPHRSLFRRTFTLLNSFPRPLSS